MIGYAGKSAQPSTTDEAGQYCLSRTIHVVRDRSDIDLSYVSWASCASQRIASRDIYDDDVRTKPPAYKGNTQGEGPFTQNILNVETDIIVTDLLSYISVSKDPTVRVTLTYAGWTTNHHDLQDFSCKC